MNQDETPKPETRRPKWTSEDVGRAIVEGGIDLPDCARYAPREPVRSPVGVKQDEGKRYVPPITAIVDTRPKRR